MEKISKTQRAIELKILEIKIKDRIRNEHTKLIDLKEMANLKSKCAGRTMRQSDERSNKLFEEWRPWIGKWHRERLQTRWKDDLNRTTCL